MNFPVEQLRKKFPAFQMHPGTVFMDAVGGTQVPQRVIDMVAHYYLVTNGNKGGIFKRSVESDNIMEETRKICAEFINAPSSDEIIFGPNFTSLTFNMSRALSRFWGKGDEIVVSNLDHDANVAPWVLAAEDKEVTVKYFDVDEKTCQLTIENLKKVLTPQTKLVTFCAASSAVGTKPDTRALIEFIKNYNPDILVYVDAVALAPHCYIDVQEWGADFVGLSTYKFFGPHMSFLWGKRELLEKIPAYKIRPGPNTLPLKWLNGSQTYELAGGIGAALEYIAEIGEMCNPSETLTRKEATKVGMQAIEMYETELTWYFIDEMKKRSRYKVWGITDREKATERVPTIGVSLPGETSNEIATFLMNQKIDVWSRSVYSMCLNERLGIQHTGGFIRVGLTHYNTLEEVNKLLRGLDDFETSRRNI